MPRNLAKASCTPATSTPACYLRPFASSLRIRCWPRALKPITSPARQFSGYRISPPISPRGPEPRVVAERRPVLTSSRASEP
ncbi:hypothetical protein HBI42_088420 [Parastagonospora nodorum]|nr:hypothetical protein HBI43_099840 [Parastagonospora nodorum]KAH6260741.1 hypothetical protein HBI42_088420 [Parastagonospora nodorum]